MDSLLIRLTAVILVLAFAAIPATAEDNPRVLMKTSMGEIELELYPDKAPVGVENFLNYVKSGFFNNTIFHRVIKGFVIQGGGYDAESVKKDTEPPIQYEGNNGLKNLRGSICYARTNDPHSATSQFFINHRDNSSLDHGNAGLPGGYGYAVFGKVTKGIFIVDKIANVNTTRKDLNVMHQGQLHKVPSADVPVKAVILESVEIIEAKTE